MTELRIGSRSAFLSNEEACQIYQLTEEELLSWKHAFETHGLAGLRTTRIQLRGRPSAAAAAQNGSYSGWS